MVFSLYYTLFLSFSFLLMVTMSYHFMLPAFHGNPEVYIGEWVGRTVCVKADSRDQGVWDSVCLALGGLKSSLFSIQQTARYCTFNFSLLFKKNVCVLRKPFVFLCFVLKFKRKRKEANTGKHFYLYISPQSFSRSQHIWLI